MPSFIIITTLFTLTLGTYSIGYPIYSAPGAPTLFVSNANEAASSVNAASNNDLAIAATNTQHLSSGNQIVAVNTFLNTVGAGFEEFPFGTTFYQNTLTNDKYIDELGDNSFELAASNNNFLAADNREADTNTLFFGGGSRY